MATLLITYDAKSLWIDYSAVARAIRKYQHIRLTEHTYAIDTAEVLQPWWQRWIKYA